MNQNKILAAIIIIAAIIIVAASYNSFVNKPAPSATPTPTLTPTATPAATNSPEIIPGTKSLLYENKEFGFKLWYPEGSSVKNEGFEGFLWATQGGTNVVGIFLSNSLFQRTNLNEAIVAIGVSPDPDAITGCEKSLDEGEQDLGTVDINKVKFHVFARTGAAAGNLYESKIYRAIHNGSCYEVVDMLHSGNIGNYPPGMVKEFDKAKFSGILESISRTFSFTEGGSGAIGKVTLSPTCPVEKNPPDPRCAPRPYQTTITVTKSGFSKDIKSDEQGKFKIDLDPGTYSFQAKGGTTLPRCNPVSMEIKPENFAWVNISCDTGIR